MKVFDFYPQSFNKIPISDNPGHKNDECLMIVREWKSNEAKILHIHPESVGKISRIAIFVRHDQAVKCAHFLSRKGDL